MFCRNDTAFCANLIKRHRDRFWKLILETNCKHKSARHDDVFGFTGLYCIDLGLGNASVIVMGFTLNSPCCSIT